MPIIKCLACGGTGVIRATPEHPARECDLCRGAGNILTKDEKAPTPVAGDPVNHPSHYGGGDNPYEVIKVLENWLTREEFIGALKFNIIKYTARARHKDGAEAHAKSAWYDNYLNDYLKRNPA